MKKGVGATGNPKEAELGKNKAGNDVFVIGET